jgi:hypothetical protein
MMKSTLMSFGIEGTLISIIKHYLSSGKWLKVLTPKVKPSFRLNFVGDTLSYWSHSQLVFCFLYFNKILDTWFIQRMQKGDFRWFGRAPACSLTTENVRFRQQMAGLNYKATAERVWTSKKKARVFARAMCQTLQ